MPKENLHEEIQRALEYPLKEYRGSEEFGWADQHNLDQC